MKKLPKISGSCGFDEFYVFRIPDRFLASDINLFVCLTNTHILIYRHARCDCKLWNALWFYCGFLDIFIHFWRPFMSEFLEIHQPNFLWLCILSKLICQNAKCVAIYEKSPNFITFFLQILHKIEEYSCLKCFIFTKH